MSVCGHGEGTRGGRTRLGPGGLCEGAGVFETAIGESATFARSPRASPARSPTLSTLPLVL